jgi:beta-phosphoglucomutase-like phosphatase (HAD superfamily)
VEPDSFSGVSAAGTAGIWTIILRPIHEATFSKT